MKKNILSAIIFMVIIMPISAQNITLTDANGNTLYFGFRQNKTAGKYDKNKIPPSYEVIAPLTPVAGKSEKVKNSIDTAWVPFVYETIEKYNNAIAGTIIIPKRITIEGVNYPISCIGTQAFKDCDKIKKVSLPISVTEIGLEAFNGCTELSEILLPPNMQKIGNSAFDKCKKLKTIELYSTTPPEIGPHTDFYMYGITLIVPPKCAEAYQTKEPWSEAKEIIERTENSDNMPAVWTTAESGQKFLTQILNDEESTVAIVSESALTPYINSEDSYDNISGDLKLPWQITIDGKEYKVSEIGENAFNKCGITTVRISSSVTSIKKGAFKNCNNLTYVRIDGSKVEIADDAFDGLSPDAVLSVPKLSGSYYKKLPACQKFKEIKESMSK